MIDWTGLIDEARVFLIVFVRVAALLRTAPLLSSLAIPMPARGALAFFGSLVLYYLPGVAYEQLPTSGVGYAYILIAEAMVGIIMGLFLQIIFAVFQTAGQLFSFQMGFGASQVYDLMAQVQIPLIGQFLNLIGLAVFISISGAQKIFFHGLATSFRVMKGSDFLVAREHLQETFTQAIGGLFEQSLLLGIPILSTLVLISVTMGLLAKAAPQMNLLMVGFPIQIGVGFIIIFLAVPFIVERMSLLIDLGFQMITDYFLATKGALP